jgi:hypothetical protein
MKGFALLGVGRFLLPLPGPVWRRNVTTTDPAALNWMSADHHRVRDYAVTQLPRSGTPLPPEMIAADLGIPLAQTTTLLDDLEKRLTFLYRNPQGAVTWAYPVTVEPTPHCVAYGSGDSGYAA